MKPSVAVILVLFVLSPISFLIGLRLDAHPKTGLACEPPCWHGITPGQSTEEDAATVAQTMPGYLRLESRDPNLADVWYMWDSGSVDHNIRNGISVQKGIVKDITLENQNEYTLGDIVAKYGPPQKVGHAVYGAEMAVFITAFHYPEKGLDFWTAYSGPPTVRRSERVVTYSYFRPMTLAEYSSKPETDCSDCLDWQGFDQ
jgi:hypothetical protein